MGKSIRHSHLFPISFASRLFSQQTWCLVWEFWEVSEKPQPRNWSVTSHQRTVYIGSWMMMKVFQAMPKTVEAQWGYRRSPVGWHCGNICLTTSCHLGYHPHLLGGTHGTHYMPSLLFPGKQGIVACLLALGCKRSLYIINICLLLSVWFASISTSPSHPYGTCLLFLITSVMR